MSTRIGTKVANEFPITKVIETGKYGWAVGYQMFGDKKLWCTWEYRTDSDDYYYWGHYMMPDEQTATEDALERANLFNREDIYRQVQREYLLEDARNFVADHLAWERDCDPEDIDDDELKKYDLGFLVDMYMKWRDCEVAFNDTWKGIVDTFIEEAEYDQR